MFYTIYYLLYIYLFHIVLEAYIKTNFAAIYNNKLNKIIGCGSLTDGTYKLEVHITNLDIENYAVMDINKGDKIEIIGTVQSTYSITFKIYTCMYMRMHTQFQYF